MGSTWSRARPYREKAPPQKTFDRRQHSRLGHTLDRPPLLYRSGTSFRKNNNVIDNRRASAHFWPIPSRLAIPPGHVLRRRRYEAIALEALTRLSSLAPHPTRVMRRPCVAFHRYIRAEQAIHVHEEHGVGKPIIRQTSQEPSIPPSSLLSMSWKNPALQAALVSGTPPETKKCTMDIRLPSRQHNARRAASSAARSSSLPGPGWGNRGPSPRRCCIRCRRWRQTCQGGC